MTSIPLFKVFMSDDAKENVGNILVGGMITQGPQVEKYEEELKKFFDYPYVLTVNSATSGLTLAYRLLNLNKTDKVISTPLTCFATNAAIMAHGLEIVWADVDQKTCNIDLSNVLSQITYDTRVLSIVHWGGNPVDMDRVEILRDHTRKTFNQELYVVEDCAHAFGAEWRGKKLGTTGNSIAVYSTQAIKHLTTGDGGIILLPNEEMYNRAKLLRWYGIDRDRRSLPGKDFRLEDNISEFGYKFHMNDINATIGLCNLPHMEHILKKCAENGAYYNAQLGNVVGIELFDISEKCPCYWIFTIKVLFGLRNEFASFMNSRGVMVSQVHSRNDRHTCTFPFCKNFSIMNMTGLNKLENQICCIPVGWWVTESDRDYIVSIIREFFDKNIRLEQLQAEDIEKYRELLFNMNGYMCDKYNPENTRGVYVIKGKGGELISTAKLHVEKKIYEDLGHIQDVVTHPKMRGKGYGRTLVKFLTKKGMDEGCYKIVLSSINETRDFYEACGFVRSGYTYTFRREPNGNDLLDETDDSLLRHY